MSNYLRTACPPVFLVMLPRVTHRFGCGGRCSIIGAGIARNRFTNGSLASVALQVFNIDLRLPQVIGVATDSATGHAGCVAHFAKTWFLANLDVRAVAAINCPCRHCSLLQICHRMLSLLETLNHILPQPPSSGYIAGSTGGCCRSREHRRKAAQLLILLTPGWWLQAADLACLFSS